MLEIQAFGTLFLSPPRSRSNIMKLLFMEPSAPGPSCLGRQKPLRFRKVSSKRRGKRTNCDISDSVNTTAET